MLGSVQEENHTAIPARDSVPEAASESIFDAVKARSSVDYLVRTTAMPPSSWTSARVIRFGCPRIFNLPPGGISLGEPTWR